MEKYSQWRDKETGIHPFFHPKSKVQRLFLLRIVDLIVFLIRLPFFLITFTLYFFIAQIFQIIPLPGVIKRFFLKFIHAIGCRTLLFILGFYWINTMYKRISTVNPLPKIVPPGANISSGDLIICNKQSYVDILYLGFRFAPVFTAVSSDGTRVKRIGIFTALRDAMTPTRVYPPDNSFSNLQSILDYAEKSKKGPVVVFPEGTNSNGRALLFYNPVLEGITRSNLRTHVVGISYDWSYFCPAYTVGSFVAHYYKLSGQIYNSLQVKYLSPNDVPSNPLADKSVSVNWGDEVFQSLANLLRLKRTKLNQTDKQEFLSYWASANKKSYTNIKLAAQE